MKVRTYLSTVAVLMGMACDSGNEAAAPGECRMDRTGSSTLAGPATESLPDLVARALPSVVTISSVRLAPQSASVPASEPGGRPHVLVQHSVGSGVVLENNAIVTNRHVVVGADRITVTAAGGRPLRAAIVGADADTDLAVLRLSDSPERLVPLKWGDSDQLRVGEAVLAIGNPFGLGESVTLGIVSGKGRSHLGMMSHESFIQVDAAINPGDSGGALINARGELVGISTAMLTSRVMSTRIGFAIPSNLAKSVIAHLLVSPTAPESTPGQVNVSTGPRLARGAGHWTASTR